MSRTILILTLALWTPALPAAEKKERKPSPFAPSLPQLTDAEEEEIDRIVDRFILADIGRLRGDDAKQAARDFDNLGPEAIFGLIRGINRAAKLEASCPALSIGKKLAAMLRATNDPELLDFARENIGAGVGPSQHAGLLRELRVLAMIRKRSVRAAIVANRGRKPPAPLRSMTTFELTRSLKKESSLSRRRAVLTELAGRKGEDVIDSLGTSAESDGELRPLARDLLTRNLSRLGSKALKEKLTDERPEVRLAAIRATQRKGYRLGGELIGLLNDSNADVAKAAHDALVKLSRGKDFGPSASASESERLAAIEQWRAWWAKASRK